MEPNTQLPSNFFSKSDHLLESKTSHLDDLLQEKLEKAFHPQTSRISSSDLAKIAGEHSPIDLAYAVAHLPPNARPVLYDSLPSREAKVKFLTNTDSSSRLTILRYMSDLEMKHLFENMPLDEAVKVSDDLSERRFKRLLELLDHKRSLKIRDLKKHHRNSAGRLMTSEFFAFSMDMTIGEAAGYIRDYPRIDFTRGIYVLNDQKELQGYVQGRNLIINPPDLLLGQVMRPILHKVTVEASREEVVDLVERYKIPSLPVVDEKNRLIGVIAHEDVLEAMEDLADATIAKMAGTAEEVSSSEPIFKRFLARLPWLMVTLLAGLLNVSTMSFFQERGGKALTFLLFFVPLITGMSGNIGIQCSTLLVRSMAIGTFSWGNKKDSIWKELSVGLFNGSVFGVGVGLVTYFIDLFFTGHPALSPLILGFTIGVGLWGACVSATILGIFFPLFFAKIRIDPALASGPLITAFNDFFSMMIYFLIAWSLISAF
jgi:magnesium transporter